MAGVQDIEIIDIECVMMTNHVSTFSPCRRACPFECAILNLIRSENYKA